MTNQLNAVQTVAGDSSVPLAIAGWLACMVAVLWIALLIVKVVKEIRGKPLASEVQADSAGKYATQMECQRKHQALDGELANFRAQRERDLVAQAGARKPLHDDIGKVRQEMGEMERRLNAEDERRTDRLREEIKEVLTAVSRLEGKNNQ
jgi:DNA polymerase III delta prime subunit